jgi:hypothetical protein
MTQFPSAKARTYERKYPNIVELAVAAGGLDVALSSRIIDFHKSRHVQPRHGRTLLRQGQIYYRWCFSDLATARAFIDWMWDWAVGSSIFTIRDTSSRGGGA